MDNKVNRKSKDSVFVKLFSDKKYVLQMYKELHPNDTDVTIENIDIKTIKSVLVNNQYNDLGFSVKSEDKYRYIILIEAQSQWNANVLVRILLYLTETLKRHLKVTEQSVHQHKKLDLPVPELYIIYSGKEKIESEISLNNEFFDGKSTVDLKATVITEVSESLAGQYVGFCKVFDEQWVKHKNDPAMKAKETYRICIEKGYLTEFMKAHEAEVIGIMEELFDEDVAMSQYVIAERRISFDEGKAEGRVEGKAEGIIEGKAEGRLDGLKEALDKLVASGMNESQAKTILGL